MIEALFTNKAGEQESISFYLGDADRTQQTALQYLFNTRITSTKLYELMEKYPVCHLYIWTTSKKAYHLASGKMEWSGKGDPLGYKF